MSQNVITFLVGFIGAIIGVIGAIFLYWRNRFDDAAKEFSIPFLKTLVMLNAEYTISEIQAIDTQKILSAAFMDHISAYYKFRRFVCEINRDAFKKAWNDLYPPNKNQEKEYGFLEEYLEVGMGDVQANQRRELAIKRINGLLKFTKP